MKLRDFELLNETINENYDKIYKCYCATFEYKKNGTKTDLKISIFELEKSKSLNTFDVLSTKQRLQKPYEYQYILLNIPSERITSLKAVRSFEINKTYKTDIESIKQYHKEHLINTLMFYISHDSENQAEHNERERAEQMRKELKARAPIFAYCLEQKNTRTQTFVYKALADELLSFDILEIFERKTTNRHEINVLLITEIKGLRQNGYEYEPNYLDVVLENTRRKWRRKMMLRDLYNELYTKNAKGHTEQEAKALTLKEMNERINEKSNDKNGESKSNTKTKAKTSSKKH